MAPPPMSRAVEAMQLLTTSLLLSNLHCPSCVSTITSVLSEAFADRIKWVSPNVVTSVVTVQHDHRVSIKDIACVLEESGFEVCGVTSTAPEAAQISDLNDITEEFPGDSHATSGSSLPPSRLALPRWITTSRIVSTSKATASRQAELHLQNCEQCRLDGGNCHASSAATDDGKLSQTSSRQTAISDSTDNTISVSKAQPPPGAMSSKSTLTVGSDTDGQNSIQGQRFRATLAVGGMTCASCVNAITKELSGRDYIVSVNVNLVANSAVVDFLGRDNDTKLVEAIEDIGYDATLDTVVDIDDQGKRDAPVQHHRTVEIMLHGIYCEHCPSRIASSLAGFRRSLDVLSQPSKTRPILKIAYVPEAPSFTIRQILAAIEASDSALKASIYHPPSLEERSRNALRRHQLHLLYRVMFTALVAVPTLILGIVYMSLVPGDNSERIFLTQPWTSGISRAQIALFIMATPVYFFAADVFHTRAIKEIRTLWRRGSRTPVVQRFYRFGSMNTLMSLGTTIAYISSIAQMVAAAVDHATMVNDSSFYFDSVVFLTLFLLGGRLIESYSKSKTGSAVEALGKLRPTEAILVEWFEPEKSKDSIVKADLLDYGDIVRIQHGASPPADGTITQGDTTFDESSLTGESRLIKKQTGSDVFAGTVNKGASVLMRITGAAGTSMLDQIVNVVREGQTKRAPMEQIADLLTTYFVPIVTLIAILTWLIWLAIGISGRAPRAYLDGTSGGWIAFSLQFAIAVFVVACPCGLGLAAPTAIFVGGGLAAKYGILAKGGGDAFEKASKIDCVVFDKTGTLTTGGEPTITDFEVFPDDKESARNITLVNVVLTALKIVEGNSSHPLARAITSYCDKRADSGTMINMRDVEEVGGRGLKASYTSVPYDQSLTQILIGNEALLEDAGVQTTSHVQTLLQRWKTEAKSIALVATRQVAQDGTQSEWVVATILSISDRIRPEAPAVVKALQAGGTRVWMLSGDNPITAAAVAMSIGIPADQVISGVLPTQKAEKISYLQRTLKARVGHGASEEATTRRAMVAMVGDGINDSPALATADVGIAIGSGSDVAISSAGFVLVSSDLCSIVTLLDLSKTVFRRIKFNFGWALIYNVLALPIAAGVLYPIVLDGGQQHVRLDPVWASLAMALSSVSVVTSSLLLRSRVPGLGFRARKLEVSV